MNKLEFSKLKNKEDMIMAFNQLKDDYRQFFVINEEQQEEVNEKDKQLDKYKNVIDKIKEIANKADYDKWELQMTSIEKLMKIQKILEEVE